MDYSKYIENTTDEELIVAVIESLESEESMAEKASQIRLAFILGHLQTVESDVVGFFSEEIELTDVSEAECETLKLNAEEFGRAIA